MQIERNVEGLPEEMVNEILNSLQEKTVRELQEEIVELRKNTTDEAEKNRLARIYETTEDRISRLVKVNDDVEE